MSEKIKNSCTLIARVTEITYKKVVEMANFEGRSFKDIIVDALNDRYKNSSRERFGYRGVDVVKRSFNKTDKKERETARVDELRLMPDAELTQHLMDIGYNDPIETKGWEIHWFSVYTRPDGTRWLRENFGDTRDPGRLSTSDRFTWDELIDDMRKNKKLLI